MTTSSQVTTRPSGPAPPTSVAAQVSMCTTGQLTITITGMRAGLGHQGGVLVFANTGKLCALHGMPGLDGVDNAGNIVVVAQRTDSGYLGGLAMGARVPDVELPTGRAASALFEGVSNPTTGGAACPSYTALVVTPPNETHSVTIASTSSLCSLQIHPVVAGTVGSA